MYENSSSQLSLFLPFEGSLNENNQWIQLSELIPWHDFEEEYSRNFSSGRGAPALSFRTALGTLIIKEYLGLSDEVVVQQIEENPYYQYFIGLDHFCMKAPFDPSMLTHFRKRIPSDLVTSLNTQMVVKSLSSTSQPSDTPSQSDKDDDVPPTSSGTLILDATCTPADITYPTDISLLNSAREKSENLIDEVWKKSGKPGIKPRTYRTKARKSFLLIARNKRPSKAKRKKAISQQLNFLRRNLKTLDAMDLQHLSYQSRRILWIIRELYRQQDEMLKADKHSIADRIVSIFQPHIRPIVRGKQGKNVEFGAKISGALIDGFTFVDRISFDNYNESEDLETQVNVYKERFGYYPKKVLGDKIYQTRKNRRFCKERGIIFSGQPLGRPPKEGFSQERKEEWRQNECERVPIEGKFGQLKRRFSLDKVMARLAQTSKTVIQIAVLVVNLMKMIALKKHTLFYYAIDKLIKLWKSIILLWGRVNVIDLRFIQ